VHAVGREVRQVVGAVVHGGSELGEGVEVPRGGRAEPVKARTHLKVTVMVQR